jgi:hypothetical protein
MSVTVWANSKDLPGVVCRDARLTDRTKTKVLWSGRPVTTQDQLYGQAGWDVGLTFTSLEDLAGHLEKLEIPKYVAGGGSYIQPGDIRRLAIHAHGAPGTIFINGVDSAVRLTLKTIHDEKIHKQLDRIGRLTLDSAVANTRAFAEAMKKRKDAAVPPPLEPAVILFVGCIAGAGPDGTKLLCELSKLWPNRKVVGFVMLGYAPGGAMKRKDEGCNEAGMRDTTSPLAGEADRDAPKYWADLKTWPWASEASPRAKVAFLGKLIKGQEWDRLQ